MKFLIIDRDRMAAQLLHTRLDELKYHVVTEPTKNTALDRLKSEEFDSIFIDPAPLNDVRPMVLGVRRALEGRSLPYIFLMTQNYNEGDKRWGVNDFLHKPLKNNELDEKLINATRMKGMIDHLGDTSQDTANSENYLGKMGFNQVFLSAMDRADRYDEAGSVITITIKNKDEIVSDEGTGAIDHMNDILSKKLGKLKRQSDLLGHIAPCEYAFLIQRPVFDSEPVDAANRFAQTLELFEDLKSPGGTPMHINITVIALPSGKLMHEMVFAPKSA